MHKMDIFIQKNTMQFLLQLDDGKMCAYNDYYLTTALNVLLLKKNYAAPPSYMFQCVFCVLYEKCESSLLEFSC